MNTVVNSYQMNLWNVILITQSLGASYKELLEMEQFDDGKVLADFKFQRSITDVDCTLSLM
jgi:hypothetical protein